MNLNTTKKILFSFQLKQINKTEAIKENLTQQVVHSGVLRRITRLREFARRETHRRHQWSEGRRFWKVRWIERVFLGKM